MITYPSNLPEPSISFAGNASTPTIRTDIEHGLVEQRGRFATGKEIYNLNWTLTNNQANTFENFFNDDLVGGALIFGLLLPQGDGYAVQPVRFTEGNYSMRHKLGLYWAVSAQVEKMVISESLISNTPPVPPWLRLAVDEATTQNLTYSHRNAVLTMRPTTGNTTVLSIYPPADKDDWIYFGIDNQGDGNTRITSDGVSAPPDAEIAYWPETLPGVNNSFGLDGARPMHRLEMDSGHTRQSNKIRRTIKTHQAEFDFTLEQLQTFQDFFYITLESGSLPFWLTLPLDEEFEYKKVRIVEGAYSETYINHDMFRVSLKLDRILEQEILVLDARAYGVYFSPEVEVNADIELDMADEDKFFICNPGLGETVKIHISDYLIRFGILNRGLGDVLITRDAPVFNSAAVELDPVEIWPNLNYQLEYQAIGVSTDYAWHGSILDLIMGLTWGAGLPEVDIKIYGQDTATHGSLFLLETPNSTPFPQIESNGNTLHPGSMNAHHVIAAGAFRNTYLTWFTAANYEQDCNNVSIDGSIRSTYTLPTNPGLGQSMSLLRRSNKILIELTLPDEITPFLGFAVEPSIAFAYHFRDDAENIKTRNTNRNMRLTYSGGVWGLTMPTGFTKTNYTP